jgi:hypothetical protein
VNVSDPGDPDGLLSEITRSGTYADRYDFGSGRVENPSAGVTFDSSGNLYGLAGGGSLEAGMLWEIAYPQAPAPTISPNGGTFTSVQSVTITDTAGEVAIYYTTDGSTPTTYSALYNSAITVSSNKTINAIAVASGYLNSAEATAAFTINLPATPTPTIGPNGGTFAGAPAITITDSLTIASIYYTTDGTTPTSGSTLYTGEISVSTSETIKAVAVANGYTNSAVASAAFTINLPAPRHSRRQPPLRIR